MILTISTFSFFGGLLNLIVIDFVPCVAIPIIRECQKVPSIENFLHSNSCICITTGLIASSKDAMRKVYAPGGILVQNTINSYPALKSWNWNRQKSLLSENIDASWFSNSFSSKSTYLSSFLKVSMFNFLLLLFYSIKKCYFSTIRRNSDWLELTKIALSLDLHQKSTSDFFNSASSIFLSTCQSIAFHRKQTGLP